jgi:cell division protease FtsH
MKIKRWLRRNKKWVQLLLILLLFSAVYFPASSSTRRDILAAISAAFRVGIQIIVMIAMAIIQFVAIFWFMSQTKVEVVRPGDPKTLTFTDYKGQPNLLKLVQQWISLLRDRKKFQRMGGEFINGLLLTGEPGTGKTLLAKCMAGEGNVAFISIEGSGFRAMFWGVDVLRMIWFVNKAKKLAKEHGACIAFIDEIDAVGMSRGSVMGGGQARAGLGGPMFGGGSGALTRLLYEMDGVDTEGKIENLRRRLLAWLGFPRPKRDWHVLFMGSTNRPDVLDPALTRPGRFDRTVRVNKPDRTGRRDIVNYYLDKIVHDDTINIETIVSDTAWATPAKIMSAITKDAVRLALFDEREAVAQCDIETAFQEQALGLENPIEEMQPDQREQIAYHEAGHAIAQYYLRPDERIVRVSIVRREEALGYVMPVPNYDIYTMPLETLVADAMVSLAGHVATKLFLGRLWTGAFSDFRSVRTRLWALYQHGAFGPPLIGQPFEGAVTTGDFINDERVTDYWNELEKKTHQLLEAHKIEVETLTRALLDKGDLTGAECVEIIKEASNENKNESI